MPAARRNGSCRPMAPRLAHDASCAESRTATPEERNEGGAWTGDGDRGDRCRQRPGHGARPNRRRAGRPHRGRPGRKRPGRRAGRHDWRRRRRVGRCRRVDGPARLGQRRHPRPEAAGARRDGGAPDGVRRGRVSDWARVCILPHRCAPRPLRAPSALRRRPRQRGSDLLDVCPEVVDPYQVDSDGDGVGDMWGASRFDAHDPMPWQGLPVAAVEADAGAELLDPDLDAPVAACLARARQACVTAWDPTCVVSSKAMRGQAKPVAGCGHWGAVRSTGVAPRTRGHAGVAASAHTRGALHRRWRRPRCHRPARRHQAAMGSGPAAPPWHPRAEVPTGLRRIASVWARPVVGGRPSSACAMAPRCVPGCVGAVGAASLQSKRSRSPREP